LKPSAADLNELVFVADPRLSPRGDVALATVTNIIPGDDDAPPRYRTRIHAFDLAGGGSRVLTAGDGTDDHPRYDATGDMLAFLRTPHSGAEDRRVAQIFVMPMDGGEAVQVTTREAGVSEFAWHPDGEEIAFVSPAHRSRPYQDGAPLRVARPRYKQDGKGLLTDVPYEIAFVSTSLPSAGDAPARATGNGADRAGSNRSIEFPFRPSELTFSSDGATLYALASTSEHEHAEHRSNLLAIDLASSESRSLLPEAMHIDTFVLDPDSASIWFLAPVDASAASGPTWASVAPMGGRQGHTTTNANRPTRTPVNSASGSLLRWSSDTVNSTFSAASRP
jgi:dipeptidyl aminopeptidase/acylaminoacyl peptidase